MAPAQMGSHIRAYFIRKTPPVVSLRVQGLTVSALKSSTTMQNHTSVRIPSGLCKVLISSNLSSDTLWSLGLLLNPSSHIFRFQLVIQTDQRVVGAPASCILPPRSFGSSCRSLSPLSTVLLPFLLYHLCARSLHIYRPMHA